jgi:hypothetical protein
MTFLSLDYQSFLLHQNKHIKLQYFKMFSRAKANVMQMEQCEEHIVCKVHPNVYPIFVLFTFPGEQNDWSVKLATTPSPGVNTGNFISAHTSSWRCS